MKNNEYYEVKNNEYYEDLVNDVKEDFRKRQEERKPYELAWQLNMNFLMGNQYCNVTGRGEIEPDEKYFFWQEREVFNHIAPIVETRLAKLGRVRPKMSVRPASNDDADVQSAKVGTKVIESVGNKANLSKLISKATLWSEVCGTSFYKVVWDPDAGLKLTDGEAAVHEGDVRIDVCPPFEIYPDSSVSADIDACDSVIHAKCYSTEEIFNLWGETVEGRDVRVFSLSNANTVGGLGYNGSVPSVTGEVKHRQEIVIERYEKPSREFPNGRLVTGAGDKLLYVGELPFALGKDGQRAFPFVRQISQEQPGCFWGVSVVERIIPVQRAYNAVKNRKHEFLNRVSMGVLTVEDGSVDTDNLEEEGLSPGKVLVYRQGATPPKMMAAGNVPLDFTYEEERLLNEFVNISGVSELMRNSATPKNVTSGVALQLLVEQDDTRMSSTAEEIRVAVRRLAEYTLRLFKQFASEPRLAKVIGKDGGVEMFYFEGSDIGSDDVVFDTENELNDSPAQKRTMVFDLLNAGLLYDKDGKLSDSAKVKILEIMGFGNWENAQSMNELHLKRAEEENVTLSRKPAEILEIDDHGIHIDAHVKFIISGEAEKLGVRDALLEHIRHHKRMLSNAFLPSASQLSAEEPQ